MGLVRGRLSCTALQWVYNAWRLTWRPACVWLSVPKVLLRLIPLNKSTILSAEKKRRSQEGMPTVDPMLGNTTATGAVVRMEERQSVVIAVA